MSSVSSSFYLFGVSFFGLEEIVLLHSLLKLDRSRRLDVRKYFRKSKRSHVDEILKGVFFRKRYLFMLCTK